MFYGGRRKNVVFESVRLVRFACDHNNTVILQVYACIGVTCALSVLVGATCAKQCRDCMCMLRE